MSPDPQACAACGQCAYPDEQLACFGCGRDYCNNNCAGHVVDAEPIKQEDNRDPYAKVTECRKCTKHPDYAQPTDGDLLVFACELLKKDTWELRKMYIDKLRKTFPKPTCAHTFKSGNNKGQRCPVAPKGGAKYCSKHKDRSTNESKSTCSYVSKSGQKCTVIPKDDLKYCNKHRAAARCRPQSAYFLFLADHRQMIYKKLGNKSPSEVAREASKMWAAQKDKSKWEKAAKELDI